MAKRKSFDKKYYNDIKKHCEWTLRHRPWCSTADAIDNIKLHLKLLSDLIHDEDYEGSQAIKDAIVEFINEFSDEQLDKSVLLNIPEWKESDPIRCHLSLEDKNKP